MKGKAIALDLSGRPRAGVPVTVDLFETKYYSHRKRLVGGFYAYEHTTSVKRLMRACEGRTDPQGLLLCDMKVPVSGNLVFEARAVDEAGNVAAANGETWIAGKEDLWFDVSNSDRIDLIPDKRRYEPGDTAIVQVRMPMRQATALVTVEREGIIDRFVTKLSGKDPVIHLPMKGSYAPNVFISVLCVRGRTDAAKPTAYVDLAKPTFKLGVTGVSVGWQAHELKVSVTPDKKTSRVRDRALFRLHVERATARPCPWAARSHSRWSTTGSWNWRVTKAGTSSIT
jgi:uncharacterized protein YfaS (alpha-2-macroglobulin family)